MPRGMIYRGAKTPCQEAWSIGELKLHAKRHDIKGSWNFMPRGMIYWEAEIGVASQKINNVILDITLYLSCLVCPHKLGCQIRSVKEHGWSILRDIHHQRSSKNTK